MAERSSLLPARHRRGHIITVGSKPDTGYLDGWIIDGAEIGYEVARDGTQFLGGYTVDELYAVWLYHHGLGEPSE